MRNVLVTGGTRGIGLAIVERLAAQGFRAIALARSESAPLRQAMAAHPDNIVFVAGDLSDTATIGALVARLRKEVGPLYGLVNNAGLGSGGLLSMMRDADIEALLKVNVLAPLILTKHVVRSMMSAGSGRIVNISSIVATNGMKGLSAYSATKAALEGMTRSLAREVGPLGITVNAVAPGFVDTAMTQELDEINRERLVKRSALRRMAEPGDIAHAVEYLLSEAARNVTGITLTVDAGNTA
jgi:3-oxoacyl-[acyl-carrier protein] reductase